MRRSVLSLLCLAALVGCDDRSFLFTCSDTVQSEAHSIDDRYVATVFERDCGATTDYSTNVSLRDSVEPFDSSQDENIVFTVGSQTTINVEWTAENALVLVASTENIFRRLESWRDVRVTYELAEARSQ